MEGIQDKALSLVLDTNIVLSGLLWEGLPYELLRLASEGKVELFTSTLMLYELKDVLDRGKWTNRLDALDETPDGLIDKYLWSVSLVEPGSIIFSPLLDLSDNKLLSTAAAAQADAIVTRDKNVLSISSYGKIQILNETQAMELITGKHETIP
ncbi:MAG: putative toxin-antitoxin system toxin component, PIN family [Gammaproteobacteria bacterium]|nr:putative toxin-antitoxin system toxin component, PIN family [Gammaproteobacteria bacterium]MDE0514302.1 putative toxin-antitoxin system toxin component, PIN family [Gammaproteobacteria bacterium]